MAKPFYPIWCRDSNKLIRKEERRFTCGPYSGTKTIAIYLDKDKKVREETAYVVWDDDLPKKK